MTNGSRHLVISSLGRDRPGIVDVLSRFIFERGGNIEESRMAVLGGEFGAMLLVVGDEEALRRIEAETNALESEGIQAVVCRTEPSASHAPGALAYRLTATSLDHPGIVSQVSHLLADRGVNIESAECTARPGPWSGAPVFHLEMTLAVPDQRLAGELREALELLGRDEGIDFELRAAV